MSTADMQPRRATIYDIAKAAEVSHQTVSRFLRFGGEKMKDATRKRIIAAIDELDYRPNIAARAMRTHRTGRLAILLPAGSAGSSLSMLTGASKAAHEAGYEVDAITLAGPSPVRSARMLELAEAGLFEGLLALTPLVPEREEQIARALPLVVGADYDDEMRGIGELADSAPIAELIQELAKLGHNDFIHIAGDQDYATASSRKQVYLDTIDRLHLHSSGVFGTDWVTESGRQAVSDLPDDTGVTAVIAANDMLAAGAIRGAQDRGWRVPEDLSVTGWDNNPLGAWLSPTLTTVGVDYQEHGRRAMARLLAALRGETLLMATDNLASVIWRGSTSSANHARPGLRKRPAVSFKGSGT